MAITFCYAPPPLQELYGKRGISPPAPPVTNHRWAWRVSCAVIGGISAQSGSLWMVPVPVWRGAAPSNRGVS